MHKFEDFLFVNTGLCSTYEYKNDLVANKIFEFAYDLLNYYFFFFFVFFR